MSRFTPPSALLLGLLVVALSLPAQQIPGLTPPDPAPTAAPAAPPPSKAIAIPDLADRTARAAARLRAITIHVRPDPNIDVIRADLPEFSTGVTDLAKFSRDTLRSSATMDRIASLQNSWQPVVSRIADWSVQLQRRANDLEQDRDRLAEAEKVWDQTVHSPAVAELPETLRARAAATLQSIRDAQQAVNARRNEILLLQSDVAEQRVQSEAVLDEIRVVENRQRVGLLAFDSAPIWDAIASPAPPVPRRADRQFAFKGVNWMREYALMIVGRCSFSFLVVIVAWLLLRRLRPRLPVWDASPDDNVKALARVIRRPVSAAIFIAVMFAALTMTDLPTWTIALAGVVLLIPSFRLLPGLVMAPVKRFFYLLLGLLITLELLNLIPASSIWHRAGLLVLQAVSTAGLWWLWADLRRWAAPGTWAASMRAFTLLNMLVALASAIANVAGLVQFSEFAARTVLLSFYGVVIVRGMVIITRGFLAVLIRSPRANFLVHSEAARETLERRTSYTVDALGAIGFFLLFLYITTLLDPFRLKLDAILSTRLYFGAVRVTPYNIGTFILVILLSIAVSYVIRLLMEVAIYPRFGLMLGQKNAFSKILNYVILLVGIFAAASIAGVELSNLALLAGGLSVGIGLGLQNVVNNFVSGLILLFERPIQVGDLVTVSSTSGVVRSIGIRASVIRAWDGAEVIVPNGELVSSSLTNWTHSDTHRRVDVRVGASYDSSPARVIDVLTQVARDHAGILPDPPPVALFTGFGDSSLDFVLRFWCDAADWIPINSEIHTLVREAFRRENIEIPFPQRDLNFRNSPPPSA